MDDDRFDQALISSAFDMAAGDGWSALRVAEAARRAGLPLDRARLRFPHRCAVLVRFGRLADAAALANASADGSVRDRLFDILMRRIDVLQGHRAGVLALLRALPSDPAAAMLLATASVNSMGWMLEAAGVAVQGAAGRLRAKGLLAVWLWTIRAWRNDESPDLSATMAALDEALDRADRAASWLGARNLRPAEPAPPTTAATPAAAAPDPAAPPEDAPPLASPPI